MGTSMSKEPRLSVIVPVYRVEETLERCVRSILDQPFDDLELILVDDGSPDRCGEMCDLFAAEDGRVVVVHKENGGLSSARNAGLDLARGRFISFVDSDDWISPDFYTANIESMQAKSVDMVVTNICYVGDDASDRSRCHSQSPVLHRGTLRCSEYIFSRDFVSVWMALYDRKVWEGLRFREGVLFEDSFVAPHLAQSVSSIYVSGQGTYYYYQREGSIINSSWTSKKSRDYYEATLCILDYLCRIDERLYSYRLAIALAAFASDRFELLPERERDAYIARLGTYPVTWKGILSRGALGIRHRLFLIYTKLFGVSASLRLLRGLR